MCYCFCCCCCWLLREPSWGKDDTPSMVKTLKPVADAAIAVVITTTTVQLLLLLEQQQMSFHFSIFYKV